MTDTSATDNSDIVARLEQVYAELNQQSIAALDALYADQVSFVDPIHQVHGLSDLKAYFQNTIKNVQSCYFKFTDHALQGDNLFVAWQMLLRHPKLAKGEQVILPGTSHFKLANGKIIAQVDYYDAGAMVYEHIPVLGWAIRTVKDKVKSA